MSTTLDRRQFLQLAGKGTLVAAAGSALLGMPRWALGKDQPARKPNFLFILVDDLGWTDAGFMGSKYYETPNIDKLAGQGMTFTSAYANAPNCAPSRACLLSGQYSPRHGVYTVWKSDRGDAKDRKLIPIPNKTRLDPSCITLAEALKAGGYATGHFGKWHLGKDPVDGPQAQGFDVNIGGNAAGDPKSYFSPYKNPDIKDGPKDENLTDRLTDEAMAFMAANRDKPFFAYLSYYAVHVPLDAKKELIAKYQKKAPDGGHNNPVYAALIETLDQNVGRLMAKLDDLKLADNTVVILFSDNGGYGACTSNAPLRGSKGTIYDGGIREPLVVRCPGRIQAGAKCDVPVTGVDFYPTLLDLAGINAPANHPLDGESLAPLLTGAGPLKRDAVFWHYPVYLNTWPDDPSWPPPFRATPCSAVRMGDWKLIETYETGRLELYNLKDDIGEKSDLSAKLPDKTKELHARLDRWRKEINAPVPTELNPDYVPPDKRSATAPTE